MMICYCLKQKICRVKNEYCPFRHGHSGKYEGITYRSSTIWCVLLRLQKFQYKGYPSTCGSLYITWTLYTTISINEIQSTIHRQTTRQWFHLQFVWSKYKTPSQELQGIIFLQNTLIKHPPKNKIYTLEGASYSYMDRIYIYTNLYTWCHHFHIWNDHKFQG